MTPVSVSCSHVVPVPLDQAYDATIVAPLPELFARRYAALPPVTRVEGQDGVWGSHVGQTRTIRTSDGGSLLETLTSLERPGGFGYRIDDIRGPMRPLVARLNGRWSFASTAGGTTVTWAWELTPTSAVTRPIVALVGRMWHGYARRSLAQLETMLTA